MWFGCGGGASIHTDVIRHLVRLLGCAGVLRGCWIRRGVLGLLVAFVQCVFLVIQLVHGREYDTKSRRVFVPCC